MVTDSDLELFYDSIIDKSIVEEYDACNKDISLLSTNQKDAFLIYLSKLNNNYITEYCIKRVLE